MKRILLLLMLLVLPIGCYALELPETYSDKVLIYDLTDDKFLHEKNSDEVTNIASLTKIVTTITALEKIADLDKEVIITSEMFVGIPWDASVAGLQVGDKLTVKDLLYASILPSGADATQALAITSSGSVQAFVKDMNELVLKIGTKNTHFVNTTGLDAEGHFSTTRDILSILKYALNNPTFKEIYCTKEYTMSNGKVVKATVFSYTKNLTLDISKIKGSKTGYTSKAGLCIASLVSVHDHDVLIITLNAPPVIREAYNVKDALNLTTFLENNYNYQILVAKDSVIKELPVELANMEVYQVQASEEVLKYLPNDYDKDKVRIIYEGKEKLSYKDKTGEVLGKIAYYYDDELIGVEEVILAADIKIDFIKVIKKYKYLLIIVIIGLFMIILFSKLRKK